MSYSWALPYHIFHTFALCIGGFSIKMAFEHGSKVVSSIPKHKKAEIDLTEKILELDKLHSGVS